MPKIRQHVNPLKSDLLEIPDVPRIASAVPPSNEDLLFTDIPSVFGVSKKAENMNEVPMSVYTVTREEMDRWGIRGLYEIFQRVPGYSFYNTDSYGQYGAIGRGLQSVWRYGVSIGLYFGYAQGHDVIKAIYPADSNGALGFLELNYHF